jgi:hypothetical protein
MPVWAKVEEHFAHDGAWRDILVPDSQRADWQRFLDAAQAGFWKYEFQVGGEKKHLPALLSHFADDQSKLLKIDVLASGLNCHLWVDGNVELDFIPTEVSSQSDLDVLSEFCTRLASTIGKQVVVTYENSPEAVILKYLPGGQSEYVGEGLSNG